MKRGFVSRALALFAGLTLTTAARADFIVLVNQGFSVTNIAVADTISSVSFNFSGLNGISDVDFIGSAVTVGPPVGIVTPTATGDAAAETVTLSFSPNVFTVGGTVSFETLAATSNPSELAQNITLQAFSVVTPVSTDSIAIGPRSFSARPIPEPSTWAMLLIGFGGLGFLGYRQTRRAKP